jgi:hypothetical protein
MSGTQGMHCRLSSMPSQRASPLPPAAAPAASSAAQAPAQPYTSSISSRRRASPPPADGRAGSGCSTGSPARPRGLAHSRAACSCMPNFPVCSTRPVWSTGADRSRPQHSQWQRPLGRHALAVAGASGTGCVQGNHSAGSCPAASPAPPAEAAGSQGSPEGALKQVGYVGSGRRWRPRPAPARVRRRRLRKLGSAAISGPYRATLPYSSNSGTASSFRFLGTWPRRLRV